MLATTICSLHRKCIFFAKNRIEYTTLTTIFARTSGLFRGPTMLGGFARELKGAIECDQETANAQAWHEGMRRLDEAVVKGLNYAFETTLGGTTVTTKILQATKTHDVLIWFCRLSSPELHTARVNARVAAGGHPIPEEKIRERYPLAQLNLIKLMPHAVT